MFLTFFHLKTAGSSAILFETVFVVDVAQLVERLTVAQNVAGSNPVIHPIFLPSSGADHFFLRKSNIPGIC